MVGRKFLRSKKSNVYEKSMNWNEKCFHCKRSISARTSTLSRDYLQLTPNLPPIRRLASIFFSFLPGGPLLLVLISNVKCHVAIRWLPEHTFCMVLRLTILNVNWSMSWWLPWWVNKTHVTAARNVLATVLIVLCQGRLCRVVRLSASPYNLA